VLPRACDLWVQASLEHQTVAEGALVTLDGSGSSDPDGDTLLHSWSQTSGPP